MYVCIIMRFPLTVSWAWILAPFSASSTTTLELPWKAAIKRGVCPSYQTRKGARQYLCISYKITFI